MSAQLDTAGSSKFLEVMYELEPPNNIRQREPVHNADIDAQDVT